MGNSIKSVYILILTVLSFVLMMQGCSTVQNRISNYEKVDISNYDQLIEESNKRFFDVNDITGKISVNIRLKNESVSSDAHFVCKKNEAIRIVFMPFPFIEAARVWFDGRGIHIWDKINSVKIEDSYKNLSERLGMEINYPMIESFFLSDIFTKNISVHNANLIDYCKRDVDGNGYVIHGKSNDMAYKLKFNSSALPVYTEIYPVKDMNNIMTVLTNGYQYIDKKYKMPTEQSISIMKGGVNKLSIVIKYLSLNINKANDINIVVNIPNNVTSVGFDDISKFF